MIPAPTARLQFRPMGHDDLEDMAALLGDPEVMAFYPRPKTRDEALQWIEWNLDGYRDHGHGLWIMEARDGEFVGDCGLTRQLVNGVQELEVGYHVRTAMQGRGYATEAAAACRDAAREHALADELVAIVHPENRASQRVAEKIGMHRSDDDDGDGSGGLRRTVLRLRL